MTLSKLTSPVILINSMAASAYMPLAFRISVLMRTALVANCGFLREDNIQRNHGYSKSQ